MAGCMVGNCSNILTCGNLAKPNSKKVIRMKKTVLALLAVAAFSTPAAFGQVQMDKATVKQATEVWYFLNELCRGGPSDNPDNRRACDNREKLDKVIRKAGWCYGREGQPGYLQEWEQCVPPQRRPAQNVKPGATMPSKPFYNKAKGDCRVIAGVMSVVPNARDHGRPIATVQTEMEVTFIQMHLPPEDRNSWHQRVADIYSSHITSEEVWNELHPPCEKMPGEVF